ncbi:MAG: hypothetical protein RQ868_08675 [Meiothermus sp.]|uniref:hypothetical protein n=1 Tax=Meiothermus sp. TaxID=1955249 RepID=UPI0028CC4053|nr:hypothetical protein [Meiothermus sp.]MDT7920651.1 hypothetical protein [Meiothermus sp.]
MDDPLRDRALAGLFTKWVEDQRDWLLAQGFGRRVGAKALPAQATLYRFVWALEQQVSALEEALKAWALGVLKVLKPAHPGQMVLNLDGKYLKAPAGGGGSGFAAGQCLSGTVGSEPVARKSPGGGCLSHLQSCPNPGCLA